MYVQMTRQAIWNRICEVEKPPHHELVAGSLTGFVPSATIPHQNPGDVFRPEDQEFPKNSGGTFAPPPSPDSAGRQKRSSDTAG